MTFSKLSKKEQYLRFVENTLFFKGGRWIANFDMAIRNFDFSKAFKSKKISEPIKGIDALIYGGVRGKGFILSRAFSFLASPTYIVACSVIDIQNASNVKWSTLVVWIRSIRVLMESLNFEWSWIIFFGEGNLTDKVLKNLQRFNQREVGLVYADLKNNKIYNSDGFIGRRGGTIFNPESMDRKPFSLKFWKKKNPVNK